jgi:hypothetical protein
MSWRICRILDFKKDCTSVHALEEIAKVHTATHLAALANKFHEELPQYASVWGYERVFPGFIDDAQQMLETLGVLLEDEEVWGAYDEWHRFMNRWEEVLPTPLWVLIGTVIVDGPGPTVTPKYHPAESLARSMDRGKQMDWQWNLMKALQGAWNTIAVEINERIAATGAEPPSFADILNMVMTISKSYDKEIKTPENMEHWYRLTRRDAFHHFGFTHETL